MNKMYKVIWNKQGTAMSLYQNLPNGIVNP